MKLGGKKKGATLPGGLPPELADELDDLNMNGGGKDGLDAWGVGDGDLIDVNADEDDWSTSILFLPLFDGGFGQAVRYVDGRFIVYRCVRECTDCEGCGECRRSRIWGYG